MIMDRNIKKKIQLKKIMRMNMNKPAVGGYEFFY